MANKRDQKKNKGEEEGAKNLKGPDGNYVYYRLYSKSRGFMIETFGTDPSGCQLALDDYWFDWKRKRNQGRTKKTIFDYYIVHAWGNPQQSSVLPYKPGAISEQIKREKYGDSYREERDYDEEEYDEYSDYDYDYSDYAEY